MCGYADGAVEGPKWFPHSREHSLVNCLLWAPWVNVCRVGIHPRSAAAAFRGRWSDSDASALKFLCKPPKYRVFLSIKVPENFLFRSFTILIIIPILLLLFRIYVFFLPLRVKGIQCNSLKRFSVHDLVASTDEITVALCSLLMADRNNKGPL